MRFLLVIVGCLTFYTSMAQIPQKSLRIQIGYEKLGQYFEQATELIEASNKIDKNTVVRYTAGHEIIMTPGFEAKAGSTFTAEIEYISVHEELSLQLRAFPNPFEELITIDYYLPNDGKINLWITDIGGNVVTKLVQNEHQSAGKHQIQWKPETASIGIYVPVLECNQQKVVNRIVKK